MKKQTNRISEMVLDIDKGSGPAQKRMASFLRYEKKYSRRTFEFVSSLPLHFEATGQDTFGEVLYPRDVYDLIGFSLREAIKRKQKTRTCKDLGSTIRWTKDRADDDIFKIYRREYKRCFAWIKAGRITAEEFYTWSEKAREKKTEYDSGKITLEEYQLWQKDF